MAATHGLPGLRRTSGRAHDIRKVEIDHDHGAIVNCSPRSRSGRSLEVWGVPIGENDVPWPVSRRRATRRSAVHRGTRARRPPRGRCAPAAGGVRRRSEGVAACTPSSTAVSSTTEGDHRQGDARSTPRDLGCTAKPRRSRWRPACSLWCKELRRRWPSSPTRWPPLQEGELVTTRRQRSRADRARLSTGPQPQRLRGPEVSRAR